MSAAVDYANLLADAAPEVVHADEQYRRLLDRLSAYLVRNNLNEAEEKLVELLTLLIQQYERHRFAPTEKASGVDVLKHLMEAQDLKQKDLVPDVFESTGVASDVLRGNRDLTLKHIKRLSRRFQLSADAFTGGIDDALPSAS